MTDETELSADEIIEQKAVRLAKRATLLVLDKVTVSKPCKRERRATHD